jgi:hypothetical protein
VADFLQWLTTDSISPSNLLAFGAGVLTWRLGVRLTEKHAARRAWRRLIAVESLSDPPPTVGRRDGTGETPPAMEGDTR